MRQSFQDGKILIIDDEIQVIEVLRRILEAEGYKHTTGITDPREAVDEFRRFEPNLVVLDLKMPGIGGLEVLTKLCAEISPDTSLPILVVTGDPSVEAAREALASRRNWSLGGSNP